MANLYDATLEAMSAALGEPVTSVTQVTVELKRLRKENRCLRAELASLRGESTSTEWGVRFADGKEFGPYSEREARQWVERHGRTLLQRQAPGPWTEVAQ